MATLIKHDDRHRAIRLDAIAAGSTLVLLNTDEDSEVGRAIGPAASAVIRLDDEAARIVKLGHLTPRGRMTQLAPMYTEASAKVGRAEDAARRTIANVQKSMDILTEPDPLDPTDAAGAALDAEIRARFAAMPSDEQGRLMSRLVNASEGVLRVADAIQRDPFGGREADAIRQARRERARTEGGATWHGWERLLDDARAALQNIEALRAVLKHQPAGIGPEHIDKPVATPTT